MAITNYTTDKYTNDKSTNYINIETNKYNRDKFPVINMAGLCHGIDGMIDPIQLEVMSEIKNKKFQNMVDKK